MAKNNATATATKPSATTKVEAPKAEKPAATPSAAPGTADPAAVKPKGRTVYEPTTSKDPKVYPFPDAMPAGYSFETHKPLKKKDFVADHLFLEHKAERAQLLADALRKQAAESKALGGAKDKAAAKRFQKMSEKIAELRQKLVAQGVDVDALTAAQAAAAPAPTA